MTNTTLLDNVKKFARLRGLPLTQVATRAGLATTSLYKWEHVVPGSDSLQAVATALGVTVSDLTGAPATTTTAARGYDIAALLTTGVPLTYAGRVLNDYDRAAVARLLDYK